MQADTSTFHSSNVHSERSAVSEKFLSQIPYEAHRSQKALFLFWLFTIIYLLELFLLTRLGCNRLTAFYMDQPQKNGSVPGSPNCETRAANLIGRWGRFERFIDDCRGLAKYILQLDLATSKASQTVKQLATKGDVKSARILAKEVVRSNKQKDRLSVSKARLGSIGHQLQHQLGLSNRCVLFWQISFVISSNGQSNWSSTKVNRDHEAIEYPC